VVLHHHPQEQFGYVIKGGFEMTVGDETAVLRAGDAYFIPPNVPHKFMAIGETEANAPIHFTIERGGKDG